jgi:hypothetical protein
MREIWLRPNRRPLVAGLLLAVGVAALGLWLLFGYAAEPSTARRLVGAVLSCGGGVVALVLAWHAGQPRLVCQDGELWVYLHALGASRVPIDIVECVFQGRQRIAIRGHSIPGARAANVVIRLAERAKESHVRRVLPILGSWQDGYITIYGTWCEPLTPQLVESLNARLVAAHEPAKRSVQQEADIS